MLEFYKEEIKRLLILTIISGALSASIIIGGYLYLDESLKNFIENGLNPANKYTESYKEMLEMDVNDKEARIEMISKLTDMTYTYTQDVNKKIDTIGSLFITILGGALIMQTGAFYNKRVDLKEKLAKIENNGNEGD